MTHASTHHLAGGTATSPSSIGDPLLRKDWPASACRATKRTETLRCQRALPLGHHPACASIGAFVERNPALVLWFSRCHSTVDTLANPVTEVLAELDELMNGIKAVRTLLKKLMTKCRCDTLDQCGKGIFQSMNGSMAAKPLRPRLREIRRSE